MVAVEKGLKNVNIVDIDGTLIVRFRSEGSVIDVVPTYLNCNNWDLDFAQLGVFLSEHVDKNFVVVGDFNVRIGLEQDFSDTPEINMGNFALNRCSRDKELNSRGKRFLELLSDTGLVVLNGRSPSDVDGHFTFVSHQGASVCDLVCASMEALPCLADFSVLKENFSDHMPVTFSVPTSFSESAMPLLPRLRWYPRFAVKYKNQLRDAVPGIIDRADGDVDVWAISIVNTIRNLASHTDKGQGQFRVLAFGKSIQKGEFTPPCVDISI
ncbi:hypothetical protein GE061_004778 [Apolygus lucorum]|uniref:Endonuclease/exonuclease/phosphatase domain-containing protein n=1 Tax=Apolygus lucorum TaxID=248454 RepID=A0A8S9X1M9_APOLU|nr:hypothetical protein GE061_004778 [Apolygus lucorum]